MQSVLRRTAKTLISLRGCAGQSKSLLGTHAVSAHFFIYSFQNNFNIRYIDRNKYKYLFRHRSSKSIDISITIWYVMTIIFGSAFVYAAISVSLVFVNEVCLLETSSFNFCTEGADNMVRVPLDDQ